MQFKVKVSPLPKKDIEEKHFYDVEISTYKEKISGRFEHFEIRNLIEKLDNSIF